MRMKALAAARDLYEEGRTDADGLAEASLEEIKSGEKGDDDAATVAVAYAVLAVSRRLELATELVLAVLLEASSDD